MKLAFISTFFSLFVIHAGLLFSATTTPKFIRKNSGYPFWIWGLVLTCCGFLLSLIEINITLGGANPTPLLTIATMAFNVGQLCQLACVYKIYRPDSARVKPIFILVVIMFLVLYEYGRQFEDYVYRGLLTSIFSMTYSILQVFVLSKLRSQNSLGWLQPLYLLGIGSIGEITTSGLRISYLLEWGLINLPLDLPTSIAIFAVARVFITLSFMGVAFYWTRKIADENLLINTELVEIRQLSAQKEKLFNSIMLTNKSSTLSTYSMLIAHEINQPLASLQVNAEFLKMLLAKHPDLAHENSLIDLIIQDNLRSAKIVRTLRKVLGRDSTEPEQHSIEHLIRENIRIFESELSSNQIEVTSDIEIQELSVIRRDEMQLVFTNLISNAIKALCLPNQLSDSDQQRRIQIRAYATQKDHMIQVCDNGPGIPEEVLGSLFEIHSTSSESGTGMGLWLSHYIMRRHGGKLEYSKTKEGGACFTITLPIDSRV
jgi:signal transduction histidine kinase